jgi:hypothetical protein
MRRGKVRRRAAALATGVLALACVSMGAQAGPHEQSVTAVVASVYDGDTLTLTER